MLPTFYIPRLGIRTSFFLPDPAKLPPGVPRCIVLFDGLGTSNPGLNPFEVREQSYDFASPLLVWALVAFDSNAAGFRCQITQTHKVNGQDVQRAWFNKSQMGGNVFGTAQAPFILTDPQLIDAGDALTCQVQNLDSVAGNAASKIQVAIYGIDIGAAQ